MVPQNMLFLQVLIAPLAFAQTTCQTDLQCQLLANDSLCTNGVCTPNGNTGGVPFGNGKSCNQTSDCGNGFKCDSFSKTCLVSVLTCDGDQKCPRGWSCEDTSKQCIIGEALVNTAIGLAIAFWVCALLCCCGVIVAIYKIITHMNNKKKKEQQMHAQQYQNYMSQSPPAQNQAQ